ncbi:MAG: DUF1292 domain-containing protein [Lachnospiraceae bacterium]|nr:DUF1292 domain-containing protein [Lachnospiraceae bacterium]
METITFTADDGSTVEFFVEEQTRVNGTDYLLVTDSQEDEASAFIFKDVSAEDALCASYVPVEDEAELQALMKVFGEMLDDDTAIEM